MLSRTYSAVSAEKLLAPPYTSSAGMEMVFSTSR
jgi:hypothetical protein